MSLRVLEVRLPLDHGPDRLEAKILKRLRIDRDALLGYRIHKRSVDARKRGEVTFLYTLDAEVKREKEILSRLPPSAKVQPAPEMRYRLPGHGAPDASISRPVVVGTGPCGLFAGLILAEAGLRPLLLDRGRAAEARLKDVDLFWQTGKLCPKSNVQFGEGGAGTFSDGKLYTQIKDRKNRCRKILVELVEAGAPEEILYSNKPHIGTDRLVSVVKRLREKIIELGGEVRFETRVTDLVIEERQIRGLVTDAGETMRTDAVILAIGHSARDTFEMLSSRGVAMTPKPFSVGLRIEHPQQMIDGCQYGEAAGHAALGAADYKLVHHCSNKRTAYTFCMCPGGQVINASSEAGRLVVNGMSRFARDQENANSALLVGVKPADFGSDHPLAGVAFQCRWEELAFKAGGGDFCAPAQRVEDFLAMRPTEGDLGSNAVRPSCLPGVKASDLNPCLPPFAAEAMREAIPALDKKLPGFALPDAMLTGVETRSSSPLRILRGEALESISHPGLFPAGEGAGYAGGIISSAVDGIKAAESIVLKRCHR